MSRRSTATVLHQDPVQAATQKVLSPPLSIPKVQVLCPRLDTIVSLSRGREWVVAIVDRVVVVVKDKGREGERETQNGERRIII